MAAIGSAADEQTGDQSPPAPLPGARMALLLLLVINLFNYIDRFVLSAVLPRINDALLEPGDPWAKTKLGSLTLAFMVTYTLTAPLFGWLGDRCSRWYLMGIGVAVWSLASGASGLAATFLILWLTRCLVGVGEAAYGPVAPTVISDLYPVKVRGRVLAWFYSAIPVGSALGFLLGGQMADSFLGWRWAFYVVVPPGLLLGLWCFLMSEPPRGQAEVGGARQTASLAEYRVLLRIPSYVLDTLGMTAMTFALGGLSVWLPTYIFERDAQFTWTDEAVQELQTGTAPVPETILTKLSPLRGRTILGVDAYTAELAQLLSDEEIRPYREQLLDAGRAPKLGAVSTIFGGIIVVSGFVATLLGGWVGDRLRPRFPGSYFLVSGTSMLVGFPMILLVLYTPWPETGICIFIACFCLLFNTGPSNTILANVTPAAIRSTAFAVNILVIHALGDVISPFIIGFLADVTSYNVSFMLVSLMVLVGGVLWLWGARHLERDTNLAPHRLAETSPE